MAPSKRKRTGGTSKTKPEKSPAKRSKPGAKRSPTPKKPVKKPKAVEQPSKKPRARKPSVTAAKRPGFKRVDGKRVYKKVPLPSRAKLDAVEENIHGYLSRWAERMLNEVGRELDLKVMTHVNRDGSVNGQLLIQSIPRGVSPVKLTFDLTETDEILRGGYWMSTTMRFSFADDEERYRLYRGLLEVTTYPQTMSLMGRMDTNLLTARGIMEKVKKRKRASARQLAVNVIWTHDGRRPAKRIKKGRGS